MKPRKGNTESIIGEQVTFNSARLQRVLEYFLSAEEVLQRTMRGGALEEREWLQTRAQLQFVQGFLIWMTTNLSTDNDKAEVY